MHADSVQTAQAAVRVAESFQNDPRSARVPRERPRMGELDLASEIVDGFVDRLPSASVRSALAA